MILRSYDLAMFTMGHSLKVIKETYSSQAMGLVFPFLYQVNFQVYRHTIQEQTLAFLTLRIFAAYMNAFGNYLYIFITEPYSNLTQLFCNGHLVSFQIYAWTVMWWNCWVKRGEYERGTITLYQVQVFGLLCRRGMPR